MQGAFPHTVTRVIDDERRQQFMDEGAHYESDYFLTLTYLRIETEEKIKGWMFEGQNGKVAPALPIRSLSVSNHVSRCSKTCSAALFRIERLNRHEFTDDHGFPHVQDRLFRYLRRCVACEDHPFLRYPIYPPT